MTTQKNVDSACESQAERQGAFLAFVLAWFGLILYSWLSGPEFFPYDSGVYWELSRPDVLLNFPNHYRGYVFPLMLAPSHVVAELLGISPLYVFRVYACGLAAFSLTVVFPSFYVMAFGGKLSAGRRLAFTLLVAVVFPGLLFYPLSDLPALVMVALAAWLILDNAVRQRALPRGLLQLLAAGVLAYGAYNTRSIYFFSVPFFLLLIVFPAKLHKNIGVRSVQLGAFVLGMALVAIPQSLINKKLNGSFSPLLATQTAEESLFAQQLIWGITIQRYSTWFDPDARTGGEVYSLDAAGARLFDAEELSRTDASLGRYFSLVLKYPLHFLGTYTRHFINGLDVRDGDVYLKRLGDERALWSVLSFVLMFLGAWVLYLSYDSCRGARGASAAGDARSNGYEAVVNWPVWLALLLVPVFFITPGAVETRFFLALHMLTYATLMFRGEPAALWEHARRSPLPALVFVASFLVFNSITTASIRLQQPDIEQRYMLRD